LLQFCTNSLLKHGDGVVVVPLVVVVAVLVMFVDVVVLVLFVDVVVVYSVVIDAAAFGVVDLLIDPLLKFLI